MTLKNGNNVLKTIFAPQNREWLEQWKYLSIVEITFFVFSMVAFQVFKFHEKKAKHDKRNFNRGLSVTLEVNSS